MTLAVPPGSRDPASDAGSWRMPKTIWVRFARVSEVLVGFLEA